MRKLPSIALTLSMLATIGATLYGSIPGWAALAAIAAWYVLRVPAIVYAAPGMPLALGELEVIGDDARTTPTSDEWAQQIGSRFAPHGFVPRARFRLPGNQAFDFAQRLDNAATGEVATIMAGWRPTPEEGLPCRFAPSCSIPDSPMEARC